MRARESGNKRPCECCKAPTMFQFPVVGPRGAHLRHADVCCRCGEQVALTALLPKTAPPAKKAA